MLIDHSMMMKAIFVILSLIIFFFGGAFAIIFFWIPMTGQFVSPFIVGQFYYGLWLTSIGCLFAGISMVVYSIEIILGRKELISGIRDDFPNPFVKEHVVFLKQYMSTSWSFVIYRYSILLALCSGIIGLVLIIGGFFCFVYDSQR